MRSQLDRAAGILFPANDAARVGNVKFFTLNRHVTGEQLADQLLRADAQVEAKEATLVLDIDGDLTA
ncbi:MULTISPECIES: hypothetical protein [Methylosinus]|uniref:hypothetical protein n=1 Tax=Methylosinus TaxID=425 RepID=UPI000464D0AB|nr:MULTISPECIES: hypothetical protein [Methylosinus]